jgi:hypothetical protein
VPIELFQRGVDVLNDADFFGYQQEVWSRPDEVGYNELVDMSEVESVFMPSTANLRELAVVSAAMDVNNANRVQQAASFA